jgi:hypothetical protein
MTVRTQALKVWISYSSRIHIFPAARSSSSADKLDCRFKLSILETLSRAREFYWTEICLTSQTGDYNHCSGRL